MIRSFLVRVRVEEFREFSRARASVRMKEEVNSTLHGEQASSADRDHRTSQESISPSTNIIKICQNPSSPLSMFIYSTDDKFHVARLRRAESFFMPSSDRGRRIQRKTSDFFNAEKDFEKTEREGINKKMRMRESVK